MRGDSKMDFKHKNIVIRKGYPNEKKVKKRWELLNGSNNAINNVPDSSFRDGAGDIGTGGV
jgi:hypothetical protein